MSRYARLDTDPTPEQLLAAREIIAAAEARGFVREPSIGTQLTDDGAEVDVYEWYLFVDAEEARAYLRDLDEPDRCTECGALQLCDCRVSLAAYGRPVMP